jgi:hypothetical protein
MATPMWPLYFARRSLPHARVPIEANRPFPFQDKATIRGFAAAYGVADAERVPFDRLPYVRVLNARSEANARYIRERGLSYAEAQALLDGRALPPELAAAEHAAEAAAEEA